MFAVCSNAMPVTKCVLVMMRIKIRSCQVIKTHTNRFCRCTEKYKALGFNAQTSQVRSVLLRPRALYFPVQHRTVCRRIFSKGNHYMNIVLFLKMTGRKNRVLVKDDGTFTYESRSKDDVPLELLNIAEKERFMSGEKVFEFSLQRL